MRPSLAALCSKESIVNLTCRFPVGRACPCRSSLRFAEALPGALLACMLLLPGGTGHAQELSGAGCPVFHCTVEATGVMTGAIVQQVSSVTSNNTLGTLKYQACSGNGQRLSCLYATDTGAGTSAGTLKVLDATTLQPVWGSAGTAGSYNPDAADTNGQVPVNLADGRIAAGDAAVHALYDVDGLVLAKLALGGTGNNFGLTPIGAGFGIVSQADGVLTLVDMTGWQKLDVLALRDPQTQESVSLVSPSSGAGGVLYAIATSSSGQRGLLFAVSVDARTRKLVARSSFVYAGRSGASPVVVSASVSGLPYNLVLVHAPGLLGEAQPLNRLVGLMDDGVSLSPAWMLALAGPLPVAPTVDHVTQTLFYVYRSDTKVHQASLSTGAPLRDFDIAALAAMPAGFKLNGHLAATQAGTTFTLLLSGSVPSTKPDMGQYVMAFEPIDMPGAMLWIRKIASRADTYTAAWNFAPSRQEGIWCPIVAGTGSGVTRLCDAGP